MKTHITSTGWLLALLPALVSADPFAYIPNAGDNTISVIDTSKDRVVRTIKTLPQGAVGAYGIAVSPETSRLMITQANPDNRKGAGTVTQVGTENPSRLRLLPRVARRLVMRSCDVGNAVRHSMFVGLA